MSGDVEASLTEMLSRDTVAMRRAGARYMQAAIAASRYDLPRRDVIRYLRDRPVERVPARRRR